MYVLFSTKFSISSNSVVLNCKQESLEWSNKTFWPGLFWFVKVGGRIYFCSGFKSIPEEADLEQESETSEP